MNTEQMAQMHEFITLLVSGIKKAELEAQLRPLLERFRASVVQELVAGSGEPVRFSVNDYGDWQETDAESGTAFYTADQLAGAVARERERCAKVCDQRQLFGNTDERWSAKECAAAIRGQHDEEMEPHDQNWKHGEEA